MSKNNFCKGLEFEIQRRVEKIIHRFGEKFGEFLSLWDYPSVYLLEILCWIRWSLQLFPNLSGLKEDEVWSCRIFLFRKVRKASILQTNSLHRPPLTGNWLLRMKIPFNEPLRARYKTFVLYNSFVTIVDFHGSVLLIWKNKLLGFNIL